MGKSYPNGASSLSPLETEMHLPQATKTAVSPAYSPTCREKASDSFASSPSYTRQSYRNDYSRAQHVELPHMVPPSTNKQHETPPPLPPRTPSPMTPDQLRFSAFTNRFSAHDPRVSPIGRNPNHHQPPLPNYHVVPVSERIKRFGEQGGYAQQSAMFNEEQNKLQLQSSLDSEGDHPEDSHQSLGSNGLVIQPDSVQSSNPSPKSKTRQMAQQFEKISMVTASSRNATIASTSSSSSMEQRQPRSERPKSLPPRARTRTIDKLDAEQIQQGFKMQPPSMSNQTESGNNRENNQQAIQTRHEIDPQVKTEIPGIDTQNVATVKELKRQLWDEREKLQVAIQPSFRYSRSSRSLSPSRLPYSTANKPVFKSKFYEAAVAARKSNTRPKLVIVHQPEHAGTSQAQQGIEHLPERAVRPVTEPGKHSHQLSSMNRDNEIQMQQTRQQQPENQGRPTTQPMTVEQTDSGISESKSVSMLVARLNAISRADPAKALTQIDSILRNESKSSSDPDPPMRMKEIQQDKDSSSDDSSGGETSVSGITDPTYTTLKSFHPVEEGNLLAMRTFQRPRPNSLPSYTNPPSATKEQCKTKPKKQEVRNRRAPPPATIKVHPSKDGGRGDSRSKLDGHFSKPLDPSSAAAIALKIRLWDEMSQPRVEGEDGATAVTEELGSIVTPTDAAGGSPTKTPKSSLLQESPSFGSCSSRDGDLSSRRRHPWDKHHPKHSRSVTSSPKVVETSMENGIGFELKPSLPANNDTPMSSRKSPHDDSDDAAGDQPQVFRQSKDPPAKFDRHISHRASAKSQGKDESATANNAQSPLARWVPQNSSPSHSKPGFIGDDFVIDPALLMTSSPLDTPVDARETISMSYSELDSSAWVELPSNAFFCNLEKNSSRFGEAHFRPRQQEEQLQPIQKPPEKPTMRNLYSASKSFDTAATSVSMNPSVERNEVKSESWQEIESPGRLSKIKDTFLKRRYPCNTITTSPVSRTGIGNSMDEAESSWEVFPPTRPDAPGRRRVRSEPGESSSRNSIFAKKLSRLMRRQDKC